MRAGDGDFRLPRHGGARHSCRSLAGSHPGAASMIRELPYSGPAMVSRITTCAPVAIDRVPLPPALHGRRQITPRTGSPPTLDARAHVGLWYGHSGPLAAGYRIIGFSGVRTRLGSAGFILYVYEQEFPSHPACATACSSLNQSLALLCKGLIVREGLISYDAGHLALAACPICQLARGLLGGAERWFAV